MMQVMRAEEQVGKSFFLIIVIFFLRSEIDANGKWLSLVPTQLFRLVRNEVSLNNLRRFKGIFLGGAALSENLVYQCQERGTPGLSDLWNVRNMRNGHAY